MHAVTSVSSSSAFSSSSRMETATFHEMLKQVSDRIRFLNTNFLQLFEDSRFSYCRPRARCPASLRRRASTRRPSSASWRRASRLRTASRAPPGPSCWPPATSWTGRPGGTSTTRRAGGRWQTWWPDWNRSPARPWWPGAYTLNVSIGYYSTFNGVIDEEITRNVLSIHNS